jgi:hypothetical protein
LASPSIAADQARGIPITRRTYGMDEAAVRETLLDIAKKIREGMRTPSIRSMAGNVIKQKGSPSSIRGRAQVLLDFVRTAVNYAPDPPMVEMVQSAPISLCAPGAPICIPIGDCDDLVVALGSLYGSVGLDVRVLKQTYGPEDQEHVLVAVLDEDHNWLAADPSAKTLPVGMKARASQEVWMDPSDPKDLKISAPEGEFIGVGKPRLTEAMERCMLAGGKEPCCSACAKGEPCTECGSKVHPCPCETGVQPTKALALRPMFGAFGMIDPNLATPSPFTQALADINEMSTEITAADALANASGTTDYSSAVTAYQAAGQFGATTVGPETDLAGYPNITQPFTQAAWNINTALAGITTTSATQNDAQNAATLARTMLSYYQQAAAAGTVAWRRGQPAGTTNPGAPAAGVGSVVAWTIGLATVGGIVWGIHRRGAIRVRRVRR